jgi:hypothetical protein
MNIQLHSLNSNNINHHAYFTGSLVNLKNVKFLFLLLPSQYFMQQ